MLSANLSGDPWLNEAIWTRTDKNVSCAGRGYGVQIANPFIMGVPIRTGAWFMK